MHESKLTNLKLYQDDGMYYLESEYEIITKYNRRKMIIPRILLQTFCYPSITHECGIIDRFSVDLGFGELLAGRNKDGYFIKEEVIEEYPQKMTLEEIEKKLGYKVELVSGK